MSFYFNLLLDIPRLILDLPEPAEESLYRQVKPIQGWQGTKWEEKPKGTTQRAASLSIFDLWGCWTTSGTYRCSDPTLVVIHLAVSSIVIIHQLLLPPPGWSSKQQPPSFLSRSTKASSKSLSTMSVLTHKLNLIIRHNYWSVHTPS